MSIEASAVKKPKYRKILIILLALFLFWLLPVNIGMAVNVASPFVLSKSGFYDAVDPKYLSNIAVITDIKDGGNKYLQESIANSLKKIIPQHYPQINSKISCKITVYNSIDDAAKAKPDLYLVIRAPKWEYYPFPIFTRYKAVVQIDGSNNADTLRKFEHTDQNLQSSKAFGIASNRLIPKEHSQRNDEMNTNILIQGSIAGLFNLEHLTSSVSDDIAKETAEWLWQGVYGVKKLF